MPLTNSQYQFVTKNGKFSSKIENIENMHGLLLSNTTFVIMKNKKKVDENVNNQFQEQKYENKNFVEMSVNETVLNSNSLSPTFKNKEMSFTKSFLDPNVLMDDNIIDLDQNEELDYEEEDSKSLIEKNNCEKTFQDSLELKVEKISDVSGSESDNDTLKITKKKHFLNFNNLSSEKQICKKVINQACAKEEKGEVISDEDNESLNFNKSSSQFNSKTQNFNSKNTAQNNNNEEIDDLEEGELKSDSDDEIKDLKKKEGTNHLHEKPLNSLMNQNFETFQFTPASQRSPNAGICRFYLRSACTWGEGCKFYHPPETEIGYYSQLLRQQRQPIVQPQMTLNNNFTKTNTKQQNNMLNSFVSTSNSISTSINATRSINYFIKNPNLSGSCDKNLIIENAWERGLRQARELKKKRLSGGDLLEINHDNAFDNNVNKTAVVNKNDENSNLQQSTSQFHRNRKTPNELPAKNSLPNSSEYKECTRSNHNKTNYRKNYGRHPPILPPNCSRKNSDSNSSENGTENRVKSQVFKAERLMLSTNSTNYYDPWAHNPRYRVISDSSGSSQRSKVISENFFEDNEESAPAAYRTQKKPNSSHASIKSQNSNDSKRSRKYYSRRHSLLSKSSRSHSNSKSIFSSSSCNSRSSSSSRPTYPLSVSSRRSSVDSRLSNKKNVKRCSRSSKNYRSSYRDSSDSYKRGDGQKYSSSSKRDYSNKKNVAKRRSKKRFLTPKIEAISSDSENETIKKNSNSFKNKKFSDYKNQKPISENFNKNQTTLTNSHSDESKKRKREELLQQLKSVEQAIALKRKKIEA